LLADIRAVRLPGYGLQVCRERLCIQGCLMFFPYS
jgi:hypothetical protein